MKKESFEATGTLVLCFEGVDGVRVYAWGGEGYSRNGVCEELRHVRCGPEEFVALRRVSRAFKAATERGMDLVVGAAETPPFLTKRAFAGLFGLTWQEVAGHPHTTRPHAVSRPVFAALLKLFDAYAADGVMCPGLRECYDPPASGQKGLSPGTCTSCHSYVTVTIYSMYFLVGVLRRIGFCSDAFLRSCSDLRARRPSGELALQYDGTGRTARAERSESFRFYRLCECGSPGTALEYLMINKYTVPPPTL